MRIPVLLLHAAVLLNCSSVQQDDRMRSGTVPDTTPFEIAASSLPDLEPVVQTKRLVQKITLAAVPRWTLSLTLGDRWTASENNLNRSHSRYRLTSSSGRVLAEAESIFARGDEIDPDNRIEPKVNVYRDSSSLTFLVEERRSVAPPRYILMRAGGGKVKPEEALVISWDVRYLEFPFSINGVRNGIWEPGIQGVRDGKLYLRFGQRLYAVPLEKIETLRDLGFQIG